MTGVAVMPISGVTCEQPRASLVVSPEPSIDARQRTLAAGGVQGIDAVMLGRDIQHVVRAHPWNRQTRQEERLGVDLAIHREESGLAER